jgi:hypothetical protein
MKKLFFLIFIFFVLTPISRGQQSSDSEFKDLEWNRYTTDNFVILSIDDSQGKWLAQNIEKIRSWCLSRWGLPEGKFTKECRVFCVPNKDLFKKLFNYDHSKVEFRKDLNAVWLILDDKPTKTIPQYLTQVCLQEFESNNNISLPYWFKRGCSQINGSVVDVRSSLMDLIGPLKKNNLIPAQRLLTMTESDYLQEKEENQKIFDEQAISISLLLRKEFGEAKLQGFLRMCSKNSPQDVLRLIYGFSDYSQFDKQYIKFMEDLTLDLTNNKTPDSYLQVQSSY